MAKNDAANEGGARRESAGGLGGLGNEAITVPLHPYDR